MHIYTTKTFAVRLVSGDVFCAPNLSVFADSVNFC